MFRNLRRGNCSKLLSCRGSRTTRMCGLSFPRMRCVPGPMVFELCSTPWCDPCCVACRLSNLVWRPSLVWLVCSLLEMLCMWSDFVISSAGSGVPLRFFGISWWLQRRLPLRGCLLCDSPSRGLLPFMVQDVDLRRTPS